MKYFNPNLFSVIKNNTSVSKTGVRHGFAEGVFRPEVYEELIKSFPDVTSFYQVSKQSGGGYKRFKVGPNYVVIKNFGSVYHMRNLPPVWRGVLEESASMEFIHKLEESTGGKFNSVANFGFAYGNEGSVQEPHLDGAIRPGDQGVIKGTIALLLYFNKNPDPVSGTELYDLDRKTIIAKVSSLRNSLFFFIQHPNSWHGFPLVPKGHDRRIVSLAYSLEKKPIQLHWSIFHRLVPIEKWRWSIANRNRS